MADVTKIKLPNGSEYDIKDSVSGYITAQTTLAGYGITDAKIDNGSIILGSNSITPLTSFTETDPTVPSWAKQSSKPSYTASEVGAIATSAKGAASGVAELDANGLVPTSQLPSYVDDVLEYNAKSSFPITGETGKIYVDTSTNLTYRWSGSAYVEISPSLALGTTSSTAFRGDYGQSAYTHAVTNKGSAFTSGLYKITTNSEGHVTNAVAVTSSDIPGLSSKADSATTLAGYGITDANIQNGIITLGSNSITPLTSYTETDPIFTASAAYGISSTDITNWNSKSDTDEKVKAVDNGDSGLYRYLVMGTASGNAETKYYNTTLSFANTSNASILRIGNGSHKGQIEFYTGTNNYAKTKLVSTATNTTRTISFPDSDGTVALASTTLAGYGITDAKIQNGTITLGSNTITPLTSYTETDPVFTASAAYGISSTDITNWDKIYGLFTVTSENSDGDYWWVLKIPQSGLYRYTNAPGSSGGLKEIYLPHSGSSRNTIIVNAAYTSSSNTLTLPNKTGTFALTSDIPTVPTNVSAFTNDAGYITSYTETDPIFTASVAHGITSNDIANWNGKADAATTLTGYGITDAYISNGTITLGSNSITPITSHQDISGKIDTAGTGLSKSSTTLNHSNSVTAQATSAVYPITIDSCGHIASYGSAVTIPVIPTNVSSFTNDAGYITLAALSGYVASTTTANLTVSDTAPSNPSIGDIWVDTSSL